MVEKQVESERKYDVPRGKPRGTKLPQFLQETKDPGTQWLDAAYYDTADRRFAQQRIVIRRRRGGHDAGWHVKFPAGEDRLEHRWPDDHEMPAELTDLLAVDADDLVPIARIRTRRERLHLLDIGGGVLAEFADDHVRADDLAHGVRRKWREWELELGRAAPVDPAARRALLSAFEAVITDTGARRSSSPSKLVRATAPAPATIIVDAVADLCAQLDAAEAAVLADEDDSVHQARIVVRRMRSILATGRHHFSGQQVEKLRGRLRELGRRLGEVRDLEVRARRTQEWTAGDAADEWSQYRAAHAELANHLASKKHRKLRAATQTFIDDPQLRRVRGPSAAQDLVADIRHACGRVTRRAEQQDGSADSLHDVRKAARRVRYSVQAHLSRPGPRGTSVFAAATLALFERLATAAEELQNVLGEHRDDLAFAEHLDNIGLSDVAEQSRRRASEHLDRYPDALSAFVTAADAVGSQPADIL